MYKFSGVKDAIEHSEYLMTESFGNNSAETISSENKLKAVDILTPEQFSTLDSFFVARIGEGIANNEVAEEMDVLDMCSSILMILLTPKENNSLPSMDIELFEIFQHLDKPSFPLDSMKRLTFSKKDTTKAREAIELYVEAAKLGDYPDWNLEDTTYALGRLTQSYKEMSFEYRLNEKDPGAKNPIANQTMKERNHMWMPAIEEKISQHSCLIAVGFFHLCYDTGLISLLRQLGYTVEPIELNES